MSIQKNADTLTQVKVQLLKKENALKYSAQVNVGYFITVHLCQQPLPSLMYGDVFLTEG